MLDKMKCRKSRKFGLENGVFLHSKSINIVQERRKLKKTAKQQKTRVTKKVKRQLKIGFDLFQINL